MLAKLQETTRLESFLSDRSKSTGIVAAYYFGNKIGIDLSGSDLEDIIRPSHEYLWNTDKTSLAYLGSGKFTQYRLEEKGPQGFDSGLALLKMPKYLNLVDLCIDYITMVYVISGKRKMIVDGKELYLNAGNAVILPQYTKYSSEFVDEDNITVHFIIRKNVFAKYFNRIFSINEMFADYLIESFLVGFRKKHLLINAQPDERLRDLVVDMLVEQEKQRSFKESIIASAVELFLCTLAADYASYIIPSKKSSESDRTAAMIMEYIVDNYSEVSINDLSGHFFRSPSYISRLLKMKYGKSYIKLLTDIRMNKAVDLLSLKKLSVETVAELIGYSDPRQFRRVFKDTFNISPSEYKRS